MAFILGGVLIGAAGSVIGGALSAKGQKDAAKTAAAGSDRDIAFQRESRDMARGDQAPYREAGYTALDALMSMTGLKGVGGSSRIDRPNFGGAIRRGQAPMQGGYGGSSGRDSSYTKRINPLFNGGPMHPNTQYNVHELGPENVYSNGVMTRGKGPSTIDGRTGYVEPNVEGRYTGGSYGWGGPQGRIPGGSSGGTTQQSPPQVNPGTANGGVMENPGGVEGGYNFMTDPGYNFRYNEGMRALETSAAQRGGLLSGGFAKKAMRYGQDYASNEYSNVYNRISNIAGLGQVANNASGGYAMQAGQGMANAAGNEGYARASGYTAGGNIWGNAIQSGGQALDDVNWGNIFGKKSGGSGGGPTNAIGGGW